jgi:hypothetical protein
MQYTPLGYMNDSTSAADCQAVSFDVTNFFKVTPHSTNEVVGWRMDFSSDTNANFEDLLAVNRGICMPQMAEKTSPAAPPNCAVVP